MTKVNKSSLSLPLFINRLKSIVGNENENRNRHEGL